MLQIQQTPGLFGVYAQTRNALNEITKGRIANQLGQMQNNVFMQNNAIKNALLQSETSKNNADTGYTNAQTQWMGPLNQSTIGLQGAQAARERAMASMPGGGSYLPGVAGQMQGLEYIRKLYGDNSAQYQSSLAAFNNQQNLAVARAKYFTNPAKYLPNVVKTQMIAEGQDPSAQNQPNYQPQGIPAQQQPINQSANTNPAAYDQNSTGLQGQAASPMYTQQQFSPGVMDAAANAVAKSTQTADQMKRQAAGARFEASRQNMEQWLPLAQQYFGAKGQLQLAQDTANAAVNGVVPPSLVAWRNLNQGLELMNAQGAVLEGVPADQIARGEFKKVFDLDLYSGNYNSAVQKLQNLKNLVSSAEAINRTPLSKLSNPQEVDNAISSASQGGNVTQMTIPKFNSREEGLKWFNSLSPDERKQARALMASK